MTSPPGRDIDFWHADISSSNGPWVHLACAIWTPEVYFEQATELQGLRLDHLTADRMELHCGICKQVGITAALLFTNVLQAT